jgi:hypothetical protein
MGLLLFLSASRVMGLCLSLTVCFCDGCKCLKRLILNFNWAIGNVALKYSLECKMFSNILTQNYRNFKVWKKYQFLPDEKGILSIIRIVKTINSPESFYSVIRDVERTRDSLMSISINETL